MLLLLNLGHLDAALQASPRVLQLQKLLLGQGQLETCLFVSSLSPKMRLVDGPMDPPYTEMVPYMMATLLGARADVEALTTVLEWSDQPMELTGPTAEKQKISRSTRQKYSYSFLLNTALWAAFRLSSCPKAAQHAAQRSQQHHSRDMVTDIKDRKLEFAAAILQTAAAQHPDSKAYPVTGRVHLNPELLHCLMKWVAAEGLSQDQVSRLLPVIASNPCTALSGPDGVTPGNVQLLLAALKAGAGPVIEYIVQHISDGELQEMSAHQRLSEPSIIHRLAQLLKQQETSNSSCSPKAVLRLLGAFFQQAETGKGSCFRSQGEVLAPAMWARALLLMVSPTDGSTSPTAADAPSGSQLQFTDLVVWLQQQIHQACNTPQNSTAAGPIMWMSSLLQHMLLQSTTSASGVAASDTWQMYELLQELQQQPICLAELQASGLSGLPAALADALIQQQTGPEQLTISSCGSTRVLQVLRHAGNDSNKVYRQLSVAGRFAVLAAYVRVGQYEDALQCVAAQPAEEDLQSLLQLWEQQQQQAQAAGQLVVLPAEHLRATFAVAIQLGSVESSSGALRLLRTMSADDSRPHPMLPRDQIEHYLAMLAKKVSGLGSSSGSSVNLPAALVQAAAAAKQLVGESLSVKGRLEGFCNAAVADFAVIAAAGAGASSSNKEVAQWHQTLLSMGPAAALAQAAASICTPAKAQGLQLIIEVLLDAFSTESSADRALGRMLVDNSSNGMAIRPSELVQLFLDIGGNSVLQQLLATLGSGSSSSGLTVAMRLLKVCVDQGQEVPPPAMLAFIEAAAQQEEMQPAVAAVHLGLIDPGWLTATASAGGYTRKQPTSAQDPQAAGRVLSCTQQVAELCFARTFRLLSGRNSASDATVTEQLDGAWVQELSCSAAATALFSCWLWQPALLAHTADPVTSGQLGAELLLALYQQVRHGPGAVKPSLDSLVLDLGLAAAGRAAAWKEGNLILTSAETILSRGKGSGIDSSDVWLPLLPEAQASLLAVVAHETNQGIEQAGHLLLQAADQVRLQQPQVQQPGMSTRKQKQHHDDRSASSGSNDRIKALLRLPVLKGYLAATSDGIKHCPVDADRVAAATAAADISVKLLVQVLGVPAPSGSGVPALVTADAMAYALLMQLLGAGGRFDWVEHLTSLAIRHRLPLTSASGADRDGWSAGGLQLVLAAAAEVSMSAGRSGLALAMLDGLTAAGVHELDCPELAAVVLKVVDADAEGDLMVCLEERLQVPEDVFEVLPALAALAKPPSAGAHIHGDSAMVDPSALPDANRAWCGLLNELQVDPNAIVSAQGPTGPLVCHPAADLAVQQHPPGRLAVQLVRRECLEAADLLQQLEASMRKAANRLLTARMSQ